MWLGFTPYQRSPIAWLCDDGRCHTVARKVYTMPDQIAKAATTTIPIVFAVGGARGINAP
jgi:hypothetical protein